MFARTTEVEFGAEVDVLVIGAGGCGLTAALAASAADPNASIAVLEKADRLQGNTLLSSGSIPAAGTRFQVLAGVHDTAQDFLDDLERVAGPHQAQPLARRLAEVSAELVEWLVDDAGVSLTLVETYKHIGHRRHRLHSPPSRRGEDLLNDLARTVEARQIPVAMGNRVVDLVVSNQGAVCGAITRSKDGSGTTVGARAVILATNGFGNNRTLLARYCPEPAQAPYGGSMGSEGEAIRWGEELGADLVNMAAYQAHASLADPHGSLVTWTVIEKGGVVVDSDGRRFGDESMGYSAFAALELRRDGPFYVIADTRVRDATAAGQSEYAGLVGSNGVLVSDSAAALARRLGMDEQVFARTLNAAAGAAQGRVADPHGRLDWGLGPLHAPYTATRIGPALFHTQGGLRVDDDARVLRPDGCPIPGLYAGGGAACGISGVRGGAGYMSGNGLLAALGLGYLAGRAAIRDLR